MHTRTYTHPHVYTHTQTHEFVAISILVCHNAGCCHYM